MNGKIILITGGARSGKSSFALKNAAEISGKKAYIATAEALDEEMRERIEKHKRDRGNEWDTYEEPLEIARVIKEIEDKYNVIVVDCLTLWLSNMMHAKLQITDEINNFIGATRGQGQALPLHLIDQNNVGATLAVAPLAVAQSKRAGTAPTIFIVSNEVGMGIVPENELARRFRDMAGKLNQKVAEIADDVYMVVAGIPVKIKSSTK